MSNLFQSDLYYMACLAEVFVGAIIAPVCFWMLMLDREPLAPVAFILGASIALGVYCSVFLLGTELIVVPFLALPYFLGGGTGCLFWGVFRSPPRSS